MKYPPIYIYIFHTSTKFCQLSFLRALLSPLALTAKRSLLQRGVITLNYRVPINLLPFFELITVIYVIDFGHASEMSKKFE